MKYDIPMTVTLDYNLEIEAPSLSEAIKKAFHRLDVEKVIVEDKLKFPEGINVSMIRALDLYRSTKTREEVAEIIKFITSKGYVWVSNNCEDVFHKEQFNNLVAELICEYPNTKTKGLGLDKAVMRSVRSVKRRDGLA